MFKVSVPVGVTAIESIGYCWKNRDSRNKQNIVEWQKGTSDLIILENVSFWTTRKSDNFKSLVLNNGVSQR